MKTAAFLLLSCLVSSSVISQQNTLFLNNFYRDRTIIHAQGDFFPSVFPVFESQLDLNQKMADSSKQYYDLTEILFKKHLIESKGKNYYIGVSPLVDLSTGKDLQDTNERKLFQNTRGFVAEVDLGEKFSFSTSFFENQGRYAIYQTNYYKSLGELYPGGANYNSQNAMIPGASRTKPFAVDGFDYAYARGNMIYQPLSKTWISAGNTPHFIGAGYRSIILSDNSISTPFFKIDQHFGKFEFSYLRSRLINMMRKPVSTTVEATYETKGYSLNFLSWKPIKNLKVSLFEGTVWSKGDSINVRSVYPTYYNPIPLITGFITPDSLSNSITGLDASLRIGTNYLIYGQYGCTNWDFKKYAVQLGLRAFSLFGQKDLMIQLEWNQASNGMYQHENSRLNFSNGNTPMALVKGNGFNELVFRTNHEWKRIYADYKLNYYQLFDHRNLALLPVIKNESKLNGNVVIHQLEMGYRFNRKVNLDLFGAINFRTDNTTSLKTFVAQIGLKTAITNSYTDF